MVANFELFAFYLLPKLLIENFENSCSGVFGKVSCFEKISSKQFVNNILDLVKIKNKSSVRK